MTLKLKSNKVLRVTAIINLLITVFVCILLKYSGLLWNNFDYKLVDVFYKKSVENGQGVKFDKKIVHVNITKETYDYFNTPDLDRKDIARLNNAINVFEPRAMMYDVIFEKKKQAFADSILYSSFANFSGDVYLPVGFQLRGKDVRFRWGSGTAMRLLKNEYIKKLSVAGAGKPKSAEWAMMQQDTFASVSHNSGHINAVADGDAIYRHYPMVVKIDSCYFPAVSLAMFLDYMSVPFDSIKIDWGNAITIPKTANSFLDKDMTIPIDESGNAFIPYPCNWLDAVNHIDAHILLKNAENDEMTASFSNVMGGSFVFVSDISPGVSDIGQTTLEGNVPLVFVHSSLLNAMLGNTFYSEWKNSNVILVVILLSVVFSLSAFPKSNIFFFLSGIFVFGGLIFFTYLQMNSQSLFPLPTVLISTASIWLGILVVMNVMITKEQAFIKGAFAKYVPEKVINKILDNPEALALSGDEKTVSILFSDIVNFTAIAETLSSEKLVKLLNLYFTQMTSIVLEQGGIIDKYIGDGLMAEFGAPLEVPNHANAAVTCALFMRKKLIGLNKQLRTEGLPEINFRVGINTGSVKIGNMGSDQVFDYTVLGDAVNLASRLEGANKAYGTHLMISEYTYEGLTKDLYRTRPLDVIVVKGKTKPVLVYEVFAFSDERLESSDEAYFTAYTRAFNSFTRANYEEARKNFRQALTVRIDDPASLSLLKKISEMSVSGYA